MKKLLLVAFLFAGFAFGAEGDVAPYAVMGALIGVGLAALGGAIGMGAAGSATLSGTARNPGLGGKLLTNMFIIIALIEAQVIYALVLAFLVLGKFGVL